MKILLVTNSLHFGGKERQIIELLEFLSKNTNHFYGLFIRDNEIHYKTDFGKQLEIYMPSTRLSFRGMLSLQKKVITKFKPDVIHTWESSVALSVTLIKILFFPGIPIIDGTLRYSKSFKKNSNYYWTVKFTRIISKRVVANSKAGLQSIDYGKPEKYIVIPNGINFNRFNFEKTEKNQSDNLTIGMVASFSRPKDYKTFIKAGIKLIENGRKVNFILIGDGPEREFVEQIIPPNFCERFKFTGSIAKPEELMATFDISVLLSKNGHSEGLSNSIMEYLTIGLPVVCTNTGGNLELVQNNYNGFLINHEDTEDVYEKLSILIDNEELRLLMGKRSKEIAYDRFDIKKIANQYLELYSSVINN